MHRDRDSIYGGYFTARVHGLGIEQVISAPRAPWQNPYAERVIGSIRRECTSHLIVTGERHLRHILNLYIAYYNADRTHDSLSKDAPDSRAVQSRKNGRVVARPRLGGLHHRYERQAA